MQLNKAELTGFCLFLAFLIQHSREI